MTEPVQNEGPGENCPQCQLDVGTGLLLGICSALSDEVNGLDCDKLESMVNDNKLGFDGLLKKLRESTGGKFNETLGQIEKLVKTPLRLQGE